MARHAGCASGATCTQCTQALCRQFPFYFYASHHKCLFFNYTVGSNLSSETESCIYDPEVLVFVMPLYVNA